MNERKASECSQKDYMPSSFFSAANKFGNWLNSGLHIVMNFEVLEYHLWLHIIHYSKVFPFLSKSVQNIDPPFL